MLHVSFSRESTVILSMYSAVDQQWPMDTMHSSTFYSSKSSNGKEVCVSMDANPAYEEVHIYDWPVEVGVSMNTNPDCEEVHIYDWPRPVAR